MKKGASKKTNQEKENEKPQKLNSSFSRKKTPKS